MPILMRAVDNSVHKPMIQGSKIRRTNSNMKDISYLTHKTVTEVHSNRNKWNTNTKVKALSIKRTHLTYED